MAVEDEITYYGAAKGVWPRRGLTCTNVKFASLHLLPP